MALLQKIKNVAFCSLCLLCLLLLPYTYVQAQPTGARGQHFIYLVEPGDNLFDLASRYTNRTTNWQQLQEHNEVHDVYKLSIGRLIEIPFELIPVIATEAQLTHFKGQVWVNDETATTNQAIKTGDTVRTDSNGFATIELEDQSVLTLPPASEVHIKQLNAFERTRLTDAILELHQGSIENRVAPNGTGVGRFEIKTPISITGVRGTNLRVHAETNADETHARTELLTGKAHLDTAQADFQDLSQAQGVSVNADGSYQILPLLPAPTLSTPEQGRNGWQTQLQPVAKAKRYQVIIALEDDGSSQVQHFTLPAEKQQPAAITLPPTAAGTHYAFVSAVDKHGLIGLSSRISYPGRPVLQSRDGSAVLSSSGQPVFAGDYY